MSMTPPMTATANAAENQEPSLRRRWWLPSVSTVLWLVFFLGLNLSDTRWKLIGQDSDSCWHWEQGNWMLQHHEVLRNEFFWHTRKGEPQATLSWLSDILMALTGNLFGWSGIVLVAAAMCATYLWLLHRQLLAEGNELLLSTALTLLAAAVCQMHWLARPHVITHLLVVVFAWQLRWFDRGRVSAKQLLILLPPLMVLWANLHGVFMAAFVLLGIYLVGALVDWRLAPVERRPMLRHRAAVLAALGCVCILASMLNPNGWKSLARVVDYASSPAVMGLPQENLPPSLSDPATRPFFITCIVCALMMIVCRPYLSVTDGLLLVVWFLLSLRMKRNTALFALIATPILAEHWNEYLRSTRPSRLIRWHRDFSARLTSVNQMAGARRLPAVAGIAMLLVVAKPQLLGGQPLLRTELPADRFPVAAVDFLRRSPDAVHGEMFNEYMWGGYLIWVMPERKVFIHPNLNAYGIELLTDFIEVNNASPGWNDLMKRHHVGWTILPRDHRLNRALDQSPDWILVYTDAVASIYGRKQ